MDRRDSTARGRRFIFALVASTARVRRFIFALVASLALLAMPRSARAEPGDELTISVLTFGPGDHPFSKFGHDGLLVEDAITGTRYVYNYGTYSFQSAWLIPKFLLGKYRYWLSVSPLPVVLASYSAENRSVLAQRLALSPSQKRRLAELLEWNAREENKYYVFDYYRDNCATRVRDLLNGVTDGALRAANDVPGTLTLRQHTERLTADAPFVNLGLDLAMGDFIDQPISFWQEMFLPSKLEEGLRRTMVGVIDAGGNASVVKVVDNETLMVASRRPALRASPPDWTRFLLAAGGGIALLLAAAGWGAYRGHLAARVALGLAISLLGLALGFLGCLFLFLWFATNHEVAYHNENILQCAPVALALIGPGIRLALGRSGSAWRAHRVALYGVVCSAAGLALKVLPWFDQHNGHLIAFFLPLWLGIMLAARLAAARREEVSGNGHRLEAPQARRIEGA